MFTEEIKYDQNVSEMEDNPRLISTYFTIHQEAATTPKSLRYDQIIQLVLVTQYNALVSYIGFCGDIIPT